MKSFLTSMIFFLTFWIILTEKITSESVAIGLGVCLWVYYFNKQHKAATPEKFWTFTGIRYMFVYLVVLLREIIVANIQVAKIVLSRKLNITPQFIHYKTKLRSDVARTILANSITLTPGTLTVFMENDLLTVHCLQKEHIQDVLDSKLEKILLKIEE
ncbi:MAG: Na+/H+ antiporter subunit E [Clostridia bacterium]